MHTKIMIIGSPGSGKSTFARKLRDKTGLPLFYLDMIKHKPDRTTIPSAEFDKKLFEIIYVFLTIFLYLLKCPQSLIL